MKIKEAMTTNVRLAKPDQTMREAAQADGISRLRCIARRGERSADWHDHGS